MIDIVLEAIRFLFISMIMVTVWRAGKQQNIGRQKGWNFILAGFGLLVFGMLIDITDNFPALDKYIVIGDTPYQAFLEKAVGYVLGFLFLAIGFWKWMPLVIKINETEKLLERHNHLLEEKVKERTLELESTNDSLSREKTLYQVTLHSIGDGVITTDNEGIVNFLNPVAEHLTDWTSRDARGQPLEKIFNIVNELDRQPVENPALRCLREGRSVALENHTVLITPKGREYSIQDSAAPIRDPRGKVFGAVLIFTDVTQARHIANKLSYQATHDPLTDLINRREFEKRLGRVVEEAMIERSEHALCFLDLDKFKVINDTCGHAAGDELLRQLARLFKAKLRKRDTLARLGGDEFGVLFEYCSVSQAQRAIDILRQEAADFRFVWDKRTFRIGVSIGLVPIEGDRMSVTNLLINADAACYAAKNRGRNQVHLYRSEDVDFCNQRSEMQWVPNIHRALEENRFLIFVQPIIPVTQHGGKSHFEVLIRMEGEKGETVLPGAFMAAAERYDLIQMIDRWVVKNIFQWLNANPEQLSQIASCAINLSGKSLNDAEFLVFLTQQLSEIKFSASKLCFEVTETAAISDLQKAAEFIRKIKALGCQFALDDFGSGLSSFAYLKNLPVDYLKIDGVFVKDMVNDPIDFAMVKSINEIGHVMGKKTIAEWVEDDDILEKLREIGVDYAQGFGIAKPFPIEELSVVGRLGDSHDKLLECAD